MQRRIDRTLIISSLACLLPVAFALVVFDQLPARIPIHWGSTGTPDNYASKSLAVFGLPAILCLINLIVHWRFNRDSKKSYTPTIIQVLTKWAVPIISLIFIPVSLFISMGMGHSSPCYRPGFGGRIVDHHRQLSAQMQTQLYSGHTASVDAARCGQLAKNAPRFRIPMGGWRHGYNHGRFFGRGIHRTGRHRDVARVAHRLLLFAAPRQNQRLTLAL